jgi:hypothetical protein
MFKASCLFASIAVALLAGCASPASPDDSQNAESDLATVAPAPAPFAGSYVATSDWTPGSLVALTLGDDHHYEATFRFATACAPADCDLVHEQGTFEVNYVLPAGASALLRLKSDAGGERSYLVSDRTDAFVLGNTVLHRSTWGGRGLSLDMRPYGASLQFDCAAGTFDSAVVTDAAGNFTVSGTFTPGTGIPLPEGHEPPTHRAVYRGKFQGDKMVLTMEVHGLAAQTYKLEAGSQGTLLLCL